MIFLKKIMYEKKKRLLEDIIVNLSEDYYFLYCLSKEINFKLLSKEKCVIKSPYGLIEYDGLFDSRKAKTKEYNIALNYQTSNKVFYMTVLHEIGHLVDLIAGDYEYLATTKIKNLEKIMKNECKYVDDVDYNTQEFFAEAFACTISKDKKSYLLLESKEIVKDILKKAEENYKSQIKEAVSF